MEDCEKLLLIQAEFDGELETDAAIAAFRHRESCPGCQAAYQALQETRNLQEVAPRYCAPESLRRAIMAEITPKPSSIHRFSAAGAWASATAWWREGASFALGTGFAGALALLVMVPANQPLLDQVIDDHVRALQPGHLEDVISTDQHTVKPWFDGKASFAPPVKDLVATGFPLIGGRLDYIDGHEAAALVYRHDKHVINLLVWPEQSNDAPVMASHDGYNAIHWTENGMTQWAVSDLEAGQLRDFVQQWRTMH